MDWARALLWQKKSTEAEQELEVALKLKPEMAICVLRSGFCGE